VFQSLQYENLQIRTNEHTSPNLWTSRIKTNTMLQKKKINPHQLRLARLFYLCCGHKSYALRGRLFRFLKLVVQWYSENFSNARQHIYIQLDKWQLE